MSDKKVFSRKRKLKIVVGSDCAQSGKQKEVIENREQIRRSQEVEWMECSGKDTGAVSLGNKSKDWNDILSSLHVILKILEMWIQKY